MNYIKDTIPNTEQEIKMAQQHGWEVYAYSEYSDGVPAKAEIRKPQQEQSLEDYRAEMVRP